MTLTDCEENACCSSMQPVLEQESSVIGVALRELVWQAQEQGRLRCGVLECAQLLEIDPFNVMMCVMPVSVPDDVSTIIERTLIEAFCHEYQIRLIKVDSVNKLGKILQGRLHFSPSSLGTDLPPAPSNSKRSSTTTTTTTPSTTTSTTTTTTTSSSTNTTSGMPVSEMCSCLLVQYSECGETSEEEETVAQHCKKASMLAQDDNFNAVVALPDD